jgi:prepilin-type N-terminal cleavage/methylation domain-containing protein
VKPIFNFQFSSRSNRDNLQSRRGFTLIELLIVIALLGALAVGLLATVDPFEQLKKGTDTSRRNLTAEVYGGSIRHYATKSSFPWTEDISARAISDTTFTSAGGYFDQMVSSGELKPGFGELLGNNGGKIFLTSTADLNAVRQNVTVCFLPEAKSFRNEANAKYGIAGSVATGCLATDAAGTACYWCIK